MAALNQLEAIDDSGIYSIPKGETVIGRGPFLGVADKRVSRNHAVLEVVDDRLRIKPIHVNPCFYRASHKNTFVPLEKDEWCWLNSGDCISLFPDKYSFRVVPPPHLQEATLRNSQALIDDCPLENGSPSSTTDCRVKTKEEKTSKLDVNNIKPVSSPQSSNCQEKNEGNHSDLSSASSCNVDEEQSRPAARKRVLPKWMLQGDLMVESLPSPRGKAGKKKRNIAIERREKAAESVTQKRKPHALKVKDDEEDGIKKKNEAAVKREDLPGTSSDTVPTRVKHESSPKGSIDQDEEAMEIENYDLSPSPSPKMDSSNSPSGSTSAKHGQTSDSQQGNNVISQRAALPQTSQQAPKPRAPCMYAEHCYRKNPAHFQEFSHPGDSDYNAGESGSQDDNDDRPECPYGTDCYRKNPQHKLEYKHTKPPGRRLRKRATKKAKSALDDDSDNDGEPNDYDLEDSFIDDDEEEEEDFTDEDSDWMPDSEDKDSEDLKQLLKEGKKFMKGKH